jgi:hypothetical protein
MPKTSKWNAAHVKCQGAVDDVRSHYETENGRLREALALIVGAFTNGVYCGSCGEPVDDCGCVINNGREALH